MKFSARGALFAVTLGLALTSAAHAQVFGPNTLVTGNANVLNTGTTVLAYDASATSTTVNGVNFSGSPIQSGVTLSLSGFDSADNNGVNGSALSTALTNTLIDNIFTFNKSASLTFANLTPGSSYALQLFAGTTGVGFGTMQVADGTSTGLVSFGTNSSDSQAYFTTETFTAGPSGIETIHLNPLSDSFSDSFVIIDAVNLQAVPEPSTWAMLFGGVLLLLGALRFRACRA